MKALLVLSQLNEHLNAKIKYPFNAKVAEYQEDGPIKQGDFLLINSISEIDDLYGIKMEVINKGKKRCFPLCDLEPINLDSIGEQELNDYATWFANR
jgi:hypothetical protein